MTTLLSEGDLLTRIVADSEQVGECLVYRRGKTGGGYGQIWDGARALYTHRVAAIAFLGPPPSPKHEVLHSCDNPPCWRPTHLRWGTHAENLREMFGRGRDGKGGSHLGAADIDAIRGQLAAGVKQRVIATEFGISQSAVSRIARGHTWKAIA
jgi:hypothetical protein